MEPLVVPQGEFGLSGPPIRPNQALRAWDAADELVLHTLAGSAAAASSTGATVIVNDRFGALSVALAGLRPTMISDSHLAQVSTRRNLAANRVDPTSVTLLGSFDRPPDAIDLLVVRIPRSLALLDDQLRRIRPHLHGTSTVLAAAMTKHLHTSTLEVFERRIGPTTTSRARKRARLAFADVDPRSGDPAAATSAWPTSYTVEPGGRVVTSHAGVFSADHLDIGTRFLLESLPRVRRPLGRVVDLGCGNGVVGMMAAVADPDAEVTFVDESARAVASAEATFRTNLGPERTARFVIGDGLADLATGPPIADGSVDRVLNNPPFHVDRAVGDAVAWRMFGDARSALRPGGELWVVGNRHLAYHAKLTRLFGACDVVASNAKFVVLRAVRRDGGRRPRRRRG